MSAFRTAIEIRKAVVSGAETAESVCRDALQRIRRFGPPLNAFITVNEDAALSAARAVDTRRASGIAGPLAGVPVAVKDNICTAGVRTTAGSRILEHFVPPYDATVVEALTAAGAVVIGKTNCDEFAMGSSNENSAFGAARNPWALDRAPGGSSGGSGIAVAAGLAPLALGSDTGGSVRQPASFCGVIGLKPTYGRVSRYGLLAFGSSLDQIGPFARTVEDAALLLGVISGQDPRDATSSDVAVDDYLGTLAASPGIQGLRLGVPRHLLDEGVDASVRRAFEEALATVQDLGAELVDVTLANSRYAIPVYYLVATSEASSNLARYDGVRYTMRPPLGSDADLDAMYDRTREAGFGPEVKRRILLGTYVLSSGYYDAFYLKAQQVRTLIRRDFEAALSQVAAVLMPTSPIPPFRLGERVSDPLQMYLADVFTVGANLAGLPAMSIPCGFTAERLPLGLQILGRAWDETTLFRIAHAYQGVTDWHRQEPVGLADLETQLQRP